MKNILISFLLYHQLSMHVILEKSFQLFNFQLSSIQLSTIQLFNFQLSSIQLSTIQLFNFRLFRHEFHPSSEMKMTISEPHPPTAV